MEHCVLWYAAVMMSSRSYRHRSASRSRSRSRSPPSRRRDRSRDHSRHQKLHQRPRVKRRSRSPDTRRRNRKRSASKDRVRTKRWHYSLVVVVVEGGLRVGFLVAFVCLSVCLSVCVSLHGTSRTDAARITTFNVEMSHDASCKSIYFGVSRSKGIVARHTKHCQHGFALLWVLVSSDCHYCIS